MKTIKQIKDANRERWAELSKKMYINGGLYVMLDYPPHERVLDEDRVKQFLSQSEDNLIEGIIEIIEGMQKPNMQAITDNPQYEYKAGINTGYNQALTDIITKLKESKEV